MPVHLSVPSLLGGVIGAWLLLALPEKAFAAIVPWLIVFACVVLAFQGQLKHLAARAQALEHGLNLLASGGLHFHLPLRIVIVPAAVLYAVAAARLSRIVTKGWPIPEPTVRFWNSLVAGSARSA